MAANTTSGKTDRISAVVHYRDDGRESKIKADTDKQEAGVEIRSHQFMNKMGRKNRVKSN